MDQASAEKSAGAADQALTFPMGCSPLVGWEGEEQSQEKRHQKETQKEGWRLDEEEGAFGVEKIADIIFKTWNLLTSRGTYVQCLFS